MGGGVVLDQGGTVQLWAGRRILIAGLGVTGRAVCEVLMRLGAELITIDDEAEDAQYREAWDEELFQCDLVIASPGWAPSRQVFQLARHRGIPVWSEVELAWNLRVPRPDGSYAPWIAVTGTNGKTTTVTMLESILKADGLAACAVGNVGTPVITAVQDPQWDVLIVELSSFQLHTTHSIEPLAAAVLNVAPDHLDWHGDLAEYSAAKGKIYSRTQRACLYSVADPVTRSFVEEADVAPGAVAVGFTTGAPGPGQVGVVEDILVDRAFHAAQDAPDRKLYAVELATMADLQHLVPDGAPLPRHIILNALAAAGLARAYGATVEAVQQGLRAYQPGAHRISHVATIDDIRFVDDSKATNPHAAAASLAAYSPQSVVWIAGGAAKGSYFDDLVAASVGQLRAVILIGVDSEPLHGALLRHAPSVPVIRVEPGNTSEVITQALAAARQLAQPGDTVLLAPACASWDQFRDYAHRGEMFAAAVLALTS